MSDHINEVTICGTLEADASVKPTSNGKQVFLRVCTTELVNRKDESGEPTTIPVQNWHSITVFRSDLVSKTENLNAGDKILIKGRNRSGSYEKHGEKVYTYEVDVRTVWVL